MLGTARRVIAGSILLLIGLWFGASALAPDIGRLVPGLVLAAAWCGAGVGVFLGAGWGRIAGLAAAIAGLVIAISLAAQGTSSGLASLLFSAADASRWYVVQPIGYGLAILSFVAILLLAAPFRGTEPTPRRDDPAH